MAISPGEIASIRRELARVSFPHSFTRTPLTLGAENPEGNAARVPGTSITNLPCRYLPDHTQRGDAALRRDTGGTTSVFVPSLALPYDAVLEVGDLVSAVTDAQGVVLLAGPLAVESVSTSAAFGPSLGRQAYLRGGDTR